ncbi:MAG: serine/threonine protein kinase [Planctomycetes bacterium]|nr:serine/threonine protein kinase [Planctomycetota bacterium]
MEQVGPYKILGKLGEGGMGAVYRVQDPNLDRQLALKLIRMGQLDSPSALERFFREAQILARIKHPGVVQIHALEREADIAYLVQDIVEGECLADLCQDKPLDPLEAARIVREVADAVAAVHREGILHRDLKPANVMLKPTGEPILLDFGIARDLNAERLTRTGAVLGTPIYMSPEQAGGEAPEVLGPHTDVYGLGVILYVLLRGQPPFSGGQFSVIKAVLTDEPIWPSAERPNFPSELEAVLRVAMAKDVSKRYPSAEALRDELDLFLAGQPTQAGGRPPPKKPRSKVLVPAWIAGVLIALQLVFVGGLAIKSALSSGDSSEETGNSAPRPSSSYGEHARPNLLRYKVGDVFKCALEFEERGGVLHTYLKAHLAIRVESVHEGKANLRLQMDTFTAGCRVIAGGGQERGLGSALVKEQHFQSKASRALSEVVSSIKGDLTCRVDLRTGRLDNLSGFDAINKRLHTKGPQAKLRKIDQQFIKPPEDGGGAPIQLRRTLNKTFSDEYMENAVCALSFVEIRDAQGRRLWKKGQTGKTFFPSFTGLEKPYLGFHMISYEGPVTLAGTLTYQDGVLKHAQICQALAGVGGKESEHWLRWSWTLLE